MDDELLALIEEWRLELRSRHCAPSTIRSYLGAMEAFAAFLNKESRSQEVASIAASDIDAFLRDVARTACPSTVAKHFRIQRVFWRWMLDEDERSDDPSAGVSAPATPQRRPTPIKQRDFDALVNACEGDAFEDVRDLAIILTLAATGAKLCELVNMTLEDVDLRTGAVSVGSRGRHRVVPLEEALDMALRRYVGMRHVRGGGGTPALWLGRKGPLRESGINPMLRRRCREAGIELVKLDQFRCALADRLLEEGIDRRAFVRLMGWRSTASADSLAGALAQRFRARSTFPGDRF